MLRQRNSNISALVNAVRVHNDPMLRMMVPEFATNHLRNFLVLTMGGMVVADIICFSLDISCCCLVKVFAVDVVVDLVAGAATPDSLVEHGDGAVAPDF